MPYEDVHVALRGQIPGPNEFISTSYSGTQPGEISLGIDEGLVKRIARLKHDRSATRWTGRC